MAAALGLCGATGAGAMSRRAGSILHTSAKDTGDRKKSLVRIEFEVTLRCFTPSDFRNFIVRRAN